MLSDRQSSAAQKDIVCTYPRGNRCEVWEHSARCLPMMILPSIQPLTLTFVHPPAKDASDDQGDVVTGAHIKLHVRFAPCHHLAWQWSRSAFLSLGIGHVSCDVAILALSQLQSSVQVYDRTRVWPMQSTLIRIMFPDKPRQSNKSSTLHLFSAHCSLRVHVHINVQDLESGQDSNVFLFVHNYRQLFRDKNFSGRTRKIKDSGVRRFVP